MQDPVAIFQQLRSIFPNQTLDYIRRATTYVYSNGNLESFVMNGLDRFFPIVTGYLPNPWVEQYLAREWGYVKGILPDADEEYLSQVFQQYAGTIQLQSVLLDAVTKGAYPKRPVPPRDVVKKFDVELYCKLIPNPVASYSHANYIMTNPMKNDAAAYLAKIFTDPQKVPRIVHAVDATNSLYLAYKRLRSLYGGRNYEVPANLKTPQPDTFVKPDNGQVFEKLFIENESEIVSFLDKMKRDDENRFKYLKRKRRLKECPICFEFVLSSGLLKTCVAEHFACANCLKSSTELQFFENCLYFKCLVCELYIPDSIVAQVWDSSRFSQLLQKKIIRSKENSGLSLCPECNYPANKCPTDAKTTKCFNCKYKFCLKCQRKAHAPLDCHKCESDLCKTVEESMTLELIRYCPKCKSPIIKEERCCNKIQCIVCKQFMCYVCRKALPYDRTYTHFYSQGALPSEANGACPLYSDINNLHVHNVISKGKAALKNLLDQNPGVELQYDPLKVLPKSGNSNALPG